MIKKLKGSEITIKCLEKNGIEAIFAYPGGFSLELHQALRNSSLKVILPRNEQGGAFAAGGYARASGKVGVCMSTSGPGVTNLLTGIADAYMDSIPIVCITGQVPVCMMGKNAFQGIDTVGMTFPIVKHSYLVLDANELPEIIDEAFSLAKSGRPGPVLIDIPKDVQQQICELDLKISGNAKASSGKNHINKYDIEKIKWLIQCNEWPCIYAGDGVVISDASAELVTFAEAYNIPVVTSLMGIGIIPESHPLSLKCIGAHGTVYANNAIKGADLLLVFGTFFNDNAIIAPAVKIVYVNIDDSEISIKPDLKITGNIKDTIIELNKTPLYKAYTSWHMQINKWEKEFPLHYDESFHKIQPQYIIETLFKLTEGNAVIVTGLGQQQIWAAQFYSYRYPRQFITSDRLGSMGFCIPAAMGAKKACPDSIVIGIDDSDSFQMNIQELGTIHNDEINIKMIVFDRQCTYDNCIENTYMNKTYPDFIRIAQGYEIQGKNVFNKKELIDTLKDMLESEEPFLVNVHFNQDE